MSVSATIVESAQFQLVHHAPTLVVTAEDVARGYVEVRSGSHVRITSARAFLFEFEIAGGIVRGAYASGAGVSVYIGPGGATLMRRPGAGASTEMMLDYRLELAPGTVPGVYAWPLRLTLVPM